MTPGIHPLFDPSFLTQWARSASADDLVLQHSTLAAGLLLGLHDTETGARAWFCVDQDGVQAGAGEHPVRFCLEGGSAAFSAMLHGIPFNRLIRQHRIQVAGDLRSCVQNWMLLYALMRLAAQAGV